VSGKASYRTRCDSKAPVQTVVFSCMPIARCRSLPLPMKSSAGSFQVILFMRGASDDAICRPALLYSLIQKQASRTASRLAPSCLPARGRLGASRVPSLQGRDLSIFTSALHWPAPATPRQAPQHLRLGVVPVLPSTRYRASQARNFITTTLHLPPRPPSLALALRLEH